MHINYHQASYSWTSLFTGLVYQLDFVVLGFNNTFSSKYCNNDDDDDDDDDNSNNIKDFESVLTDRQTCRLVASQKPY